VCFAGILDKNWHLLFLIDMDKKNAITFITLFFLFTLFFPFRDLQEHGKHFLILVTPGNSTK